MPSRLAAPRYRWVSVVLAAGAMGASGTYQFVWSSLRPALAAQLGASEAALGTVFTVFVVTQTVSQIPAGRFRDRHGPRIPMILAAGFLVASYAGTAFATSTLHVLLCYGLGGIGAGIAYTVAVNTPVKWFSTRQGLATGVVAMAYGGVSVVLIPSIRRGLDDNFAGTLLGLAAVVGIAALLVVAFLRDPDDASTEDAASLDVEESYGWRTLVRTWQFWLLYALFVTVNGVGLMIIGKAVSYATELGLSPAIATAVASVVALSDSAGIVTLGGLSDRFGRERTIATTITLCGLATAASVWVGTAGRETLFVLCLGAATFFRSPVFAIAPGLVGDYYGPARSSENYAVLYTSKIWGGIGGGVVASVLVATTGWSTAFLAGATLVTAVGLLSTRLRPVELNAA